MNILLMHNGGDAGLPSGETVVFNAEAAALRRAGCMVHQHLATGESGLSGKIRKANVFWSRSSWRTTRELVQTHRPDLVHFHGVLPDLTMSAFAACRDAGVPVVQTLHNYRWICVEGGLFRDSAFCDDCVCGNGWQGVRKRCSRGSTVVSALLAMNNRFARKEGRLFSLVNRFVAVSQFVKDQHVRGGFPAGQITVKYNGVSIPPRAEPPPDGQFVNGDAAVVSFVGRLDVAKGTSILGQLPDLMESRCPVQFKIAGAGPDEQMLRERFAKHSNVEFLGRLSADLVTELLQSSDCVIVPSIVPESFGLVAAEAMACGTPVLASKIGGLAELLSTSGAGWAVEPTASPAAFADTLQEILKGTLRMEKAALGRTFAESKLDIEKTTCDLLEIYESVMARPAGKAQTSRKAKA